MKIIEEFKKFAIKGNVIDMSVGIIIGSAFGKIVTSFVNDILMPPLSLLTGGVNLNNKIITLKKAAEGVEAITLNYGSFLNVISDFLIIAFSIFMVIKQMNKLNKKDQKEKERKEPIAKDIQLLTEIRDELKSLSTK